MKALRIELFVTFESKQKSIILDSDPLFFGTNDICEFKLGLGEPQIKAIIQRHEKGALVKVLDPEIKIKINGEDHSSIEIDKNSYFKLGNIDIIVTVSEIEQLVSTPSLPEIPSVPEFLQDDVLVEVKSEVKSEVHSEIKEVHSEIKEVHTNNTPKFLEERFTSEENLEFNDITKNVFTEFHTFNTSFEEGVTADVSDVSFKCIGQDFSKYIDIKDETIVELPSESIEIVGEELCFQIVHQHNGIVFSCEHFDIRRDKIYISNQKSSKNTFQVHDFDHSKTLFISKNKNQHIVNVIDGFTTHIGDDGGYTPVDKDKIIFSEGQNVLFTKGLSQIIIRQVPSPSRLLSDGFLNFDDRLLKNIATSWACVMLPLLFIFIFSDAPRERVELKKELVVIYKPKKVVAKPVEKVKVTEVKEASQAAVAEASAPKAPAAEKKIAKVVTTKEIVQKSTAVKKIQPKVSNVKVKKVVKKKFKRLSKVKKAMVSQVSKPVVKKKSYSFSSSKKMNSLLGSKNINFKKAQLAKVDSSFTSGKSSSTSKEFNSNSFGESGIKPSSVSLSSRSGRAMASGTKGLSGKSRSVTSYQETSTKVLGAIDPELIRKIMREYIPQFRYCYQRELAKNDKVAGVFDVNFKINSFGKGAQVITNADDFTPKGINCLKRVISTINFPKPKGGGSVDVKQPMNFYKI